MRIVRPALVALALSAVLAAGAARAQSAGAPYASTGTAYPFVAVDGIRSAGSSFVVRGVLQGEAAPRELTFTLTTSVTLAVEAQRSCERYLVLAMEKPGAYVVTITQAGTPAAICTISRVNP